MYDTNTLAVLHFTRTRCARGYIGGLYMRYIGALYAQYIGTLRAGYMGALYARVAREVRVCIEPPAPEPPLPLLNTKEGRCRGSVFCCCLGVPDREAYKHA